MAQTFGRESAWAGGKLDELVFKFRILESFTLLALSGRRSIMEKLGR